MRNKVALLGIITLAGFALSGCAFTNQQIVLDYHLSSEVAPVTPPAGVSVAIGQIEDKRGVEDPNILFHKMNLYGNVTSGAYLAEKPLADIVQEALMEAFPQTPESSNNRDCVLYGKMLDFGYDSVMGLSRTQINSKLSAQMYLEDTSTGRILWSEAFVGRALVKEYHGEKDAIVKMVGFAVDDLVG